MVANVEILQILSTATTELRLVAGPQPLHVGGGHQDKGEQKRVRVSSIVMDAGGLEEVGLISLVAAITI